VGHRYLQGTYYPYDIEIELGATLDEEITTPKFIDAVRPTPDLFPPGKSLYNIFQPSLYYSQPHDIGPKFNNTN
jgi:hypothetical protein